MLINERDKGVAVLLISFELDEVMNVSDRIAVIYDGHIQQIFEQGTVDNRTLGRVMAGGTVDEEELKAVRAAVEAEAAAVIPAETPEESAVPAADAPADVLAEAAAVIPTEAPEEPAEAIEESLEAPEEPTEAPEESAEAPEEHTEAPEEPAEAPEEPMTEAQVRENMEDTQKQLIAMQQKLSEMQ